LIGIDGEIAGGGERNIQIRTGGGLESEGTGGGVDSRGATREIEGGVGSG